MESLHGPKRWIDFPVELSLIELQLEEGLIYGGLAPGIDEAAAEGPGLREYERVVEEIGGKTSWAGSSDTL